MLNGILKIADDVLDCKDACLTNDITQCKIVVSAWTPLNLLILLSYFALLLLWTIYSIQSDQFCPLGQFLLHYELDFRKPLLSGYLANSWGWPLNNRGLTVSGNILNIFKRLVVVVVTCTSTLTLAMPAKFWQPDVFSKFVFFFHIKIIYFYFQSLYLSITLNSAIFYYIYYNWCHPGSKMIDLRKIWI